ncbi:hypothetical protein AHF37_09719 [Paragonimus kellicotti]|nr:hypothetical protein AHF37_09719 [Paragonimus kellicotti]
MVRPRAKYFTSSTSSDEPRMKTSPSEVTRSINSWSAFESKCETESKMESSGTLMGKPDTTFFLVMKAHQVSSTNSTTRFDGRNPGPMVRPRAKYFTSSTSSDEPRMKTSPSEVTRSINSWSAFESKCETESKMESSGTLMGKPDTTFFLVMKELIQDAVAESFARYSSSQRSADKSPVKDMNYEARSKENPLTDCLSKGISGSDNKPNESAITSTFRLSDMNDLKCFGRPLMNTSAFSVIASEKMRGKGGKMTRFAGKIFICRIAKHITNPPGRWSYPAAPSLLISLPIILSII